MDKADGLAVLAILLEVGSGPFFVWLRIYFQSLNHQRPLTYKFPRLFNNAVADQASSFSLLEKGQIPAAHT